MNLKSGKNNKNTKSQPYQNYLVKIMCFLYKKKVYCKMTEP